MLHDYNIVLEAAAAGQGVAMGRHRLIQSRLNAGTLVEALPDVCYEGRIGHWLVTRTGTPREAVQDFVEWITKAARQQDLTMIRGSCAALQSRREYTPRHKPFATHLTQPDSVAVD
jgi:LysR substrate binding domain